jgi:hypothetical protein
MRKLQVMGVEDDWLVVVSESGDRFHIAIDDTLRSALRGPQRPPGSQRVSPKDIQAHIRRGLSAQEVADLTGESIDYISLFEGPVVAEREFIAQQAQAIRFQHASERDDETSFGSWVRSRLDHLGAHDATWSAWKEETGWQVEVRFIDGEVEHRATWSFEPRKQLLVPLNDDATVLSQSEPIQGPLIPRLRPVVATDDNPAGERFDSEMFEGMSLSDTGPLTEPVAYGKTGSQPSAPPENASATNETADLLEALRRRRGERESAPDVDDLAKSHHPSTGSIRLVDPDSSGKDDDSDHRASVHQFPGTGELPRPDEDAGDENTDQSPAQPKKGRPEMPSWDDIVFGTKPDDDPA